MKTYFPKLVMLDDFVKILTSKISPRYWTIWQHRKKIPFQLQYSGIAFFNFGLRLRGENWLFHFFMINFRPEWWPCALAECTFAYSCSPQKSESLLCTWFSIKQVFEDDFLNLDSHSLTDLIPILSSAHDAIYEK